MADQNMAAQEEVLLDVRVAGGLKPLQILSQPGKEDPRNISRHNFSHDLGADRQYVQGLLTPCS